MAFHTDLLLKDPKNEKVLFKNQYGMAMTPPLPYGCIKRKSTVPSFEALEQLLKSVTLEDKIGHIFAVDIEFSDINPETLLFNKIFPLIFEKNKKIYPIYGLVLR